MNCMNSIIPMSTYMIFFYHHYNHKHQSASSSPWRGGDVHIVPLRQIGNVFWENVVDAEKYIIYNNINNVSEQVDELKPVNVVLSKNILGGTRHQSWFPEYTLLQKNIKTNILKTPAARIFSRSFKLPSVWSRVHLGGHASDVWWWMSPGISRSITWQWRWQLQWQWHWQVLMKVRHTITLILMLIMIAMIRKFMMGILRNDNRYLLAPLSLMLFRGSLILQWSKSFWSDWILFIRLKNLFWFLPPPSSRVVTKEVGWRGRL